MLDWESVSFLRWVGVGLESFKLALEDDGTPQFNPVPIELLTSIFNSYPSLKRIALDCISVSKPSINFNPTRLFLPNLETLHLDSIWLRGHQLFSNASFPR